MSSSGSFSAISMSNTSMPANFLNRQPLPSITGLPASGADVAEAEHRGAVGDDRDEVAARGQVAGFARVVGDRHAGVGDARRVGERQVALVGQRLGRRDRDLAGRRKAVVVERGLAKVSSVMSRSPVVSRISKRLRRDRRLRVALQHAPDAGDERCRLVGMHPVPRVVDELDLGLANMGRNASRPRSRDVVRVRPGDHAPRVRRSAGRAATSGRRRAAASPG